MNERSYFELRTKQKACQATGLILLQYLIADAYSARILLNPALDPRLRLGINHTRVYKRWWGLLNNMHLRKVEILGRARPHHLGNSSPG